MRRCKTLPAPHCSTHLGHVLWGVMRCMFFRAAFCRSVNVILSYASFYRSADLANLVPLVHGFHLEPVILP